METNEQLHRELWGWLAETGSKNKAAWPGWEALEDMPHRYVARAIHCRCFACQEGHDRDKNLEECSNCPLDFGCGYGSCQSPGSLYDQWDYCLDNRIKTLKKLAAKIRDLPWREKE